MGSDASVQTRVENILLEADRLALRVLAPAARKSIVVLKSLYRGDKSEDEILAECMMVYPGCKNLKPTILFLEKLGVVTRKPWKDGKYSLTDYGRSVAEALFDIIKDVRSIVESALRGSMNVIDLYVQLVTPAMSMIEIALGSRTKVELLLTLVIHAYISALIASTLSILSREDPRFKSVLAEIEKMIVGETGEQLDEFSDE
ncbi:hypothetical protein Pyrfu_1565 [Pyrolobus fumarii 1A]|uniref:Uncharacterized protein n=1 Tax=Pyrolobus fumarii (strain DSM 11204 / 1A) TaxID=694429 RepID=G0EC52_PYRF1|nr:hypothetical protein [Pyrolobus fumarii]AEM39422.1 hypothetical protein Pyrfu_1565 [Pyrolobus fumarii 1A]